MAQPIATVTPITSESALIDSPSGSFSGFSPLCHSPITQFAFSPVGLPTRPPPLCTPPRRSHTGCSSIPSLSITPSACDSPQHSPPLSPAVHGPSPMSRRPVPLAPGSLFAACPSTLSPTPFSPYHRRHASQPSTPLPVKETFNGSLSDLGLEDGQRQLNQYTLLRSIGRGSYGSVALARDTLASNASGHDVLYAIKEYSKSRMRKLARATLPRLRRPRPPPVRTGSDGMELVKAEVAIMKKLSHPNIASLIEVIDTDTDSLFYVLELCPFGPVSGPLSTSSARNVFKQLVLGIEYLHFNMVVHRDIKPDNILYAENPALEPEPICKIVDFGVSEHFASSEDDTTQRSAGSPAFLSPELCTSAGGAQGKAADIWAMGATLFVLVTGRLPFEASNPLALSHMIVNDPLVLPPDLEPDLVNLLESLLDKSPTTRIEMKALRTHPWLNPAGHSALPTTSENVTPVDPPTAHEIAHAFKSLRSLSTILRAVTKLKARYRRTLSVGGTKEASFEKAQEDGQGLMASPLALPIELPDGLEEELQSRLIIQGD